MAAPTCKTCPWFHVEGDFPAGCGGCHHESAATDSNGPDDISNQRSDEWWCSAHPERQPRVCLDCKGVGFITYNHEHETGYVSMESEHCPTCKGTGKVIPKFEK